VPYLQIYDYAQYYLDLADANLKIEQQKDTSDQPQISFEQPMTAQKSVNDQALLAASSLTSAGAAAGKGLGSLGSFGSSSVMRPPSQYGLWRVEYNFTSLYEIEDINPSSMESISTKLRSNQTWFDTYFRHNMVNYEAAWECDLMCRAAQTCAISHVDYSQYAHCVEQAALAHGLQKGDLNEAAINQASSAMPQAHIFLLLLMSYCVKVLW